MASRGNPGWWKGTENPFPRAAVTRTSGLRPDAPTIPTPAVDEIRQLIDGYVAETLAAGDFRPDSESLPGDGRVIVIEGDYGTGKTHLVLEALNHVRSGRKSSLDPRPCYRVAPGRSFLLLYTDIMRNGIKADEVFRRVLEFYTDVVADGLRARPFAERLVSQLESGEADPRRVISRYGLKEGALLAELRTRLSSVTEDETFSQALMLLLQPELRDMVWEWLTGGVPGQLLRENGLTKTIDTDIRALEALGVIARIYRRGKRRFVLAVDEMEKLVLSWDSSDKGKSQAFKKLLEIFRRTGALLIMAGLPEIIDILPPETQRVDAIIQPSDWRSQDVRRFVETSIESRHHRKTIEPFTNAGIDYIVYLTRGLARDVVRLCYHSYHTAAISGGLITSETVNNTALTRSRKGSGEMVRHSIRRLLADQARNPIEGWTFSDLPEVPVDFWIPIDERDIGCAVLISDSISDEHQAGIFAERIATIRSADSGRGVIQVVSGYLPDDLRLVLEAALQGEPLILYNPRSFDDDFTRAMERSIEAVVGDTPDSFPGTGVLQWLRQETGRLARQQSAILRLIQGSAGREEQLLATVQHALAEPATEAADPPPDLPRELEEMFGAAERSLAAYGDLSARVNDTFDLAVEAPSAALSLVARLGDLDAFGSIGAMTFLSDLLRGFRVSVRGWLDTRRRAGESTAGEEQLRGICETYDALYGVVPLFALDRLPVITSPLGTDDQPSARAGWVARADSLRDSLDGLGERVYATAIDLAEGGPGSLRARGSGTERADDSVAQRRQLLVGDIHLSLDEGDPHEGIPGVLQREDVDGSAGDIDHQPGQPSAPGAVQQLLDPEAVHGDLPDDLVIPVPPGLRGYPLEERAQGMVLEDIRPPDEPAAAVEAHEMKIVEMQRVPAPVRHRS